MVLRVVSLSWRRLICLNTSICIVYVCICMYMYIMQRTICSNPSWKCTVRTLYTMSLRCQIELYPRYWPFVLGIHRSPVNSPAQRPVSRSFDIFFDLPLNKRLSKPSWGWWFETLSCPLWRHRNVGRGCWLLRCRWRNPLLKARVVMMCIEYHFKSSDW